MSSSNIHDGSNQRKSPPPSKNEHEEHSHRDKVTDSLEPDSKRVRKDPADPKHEVDLPLFPEYNHHIDARVEASFWKDALKVLAQGKHPHCVYYETDKFVAVYDGYNKARYHLLLMAKQPQPPSSSSLHFDRVNRITDLDDSHMGILHAFHKLGIQIAYHLEAQLISDYGRKGYTTSRMQDRHREYLDQYLSAAKLATQPLPPSIYPPFISLGYHAIPSLPPLHLHIISQDFDSPRLKTKDHWNSFTTQFLVHPHKVEDEISRNGQVRVNRDEMGMAKKGDMKCTGCGMDFKNQFAKLKAHISQGCILHTRFGIEM